MSAGATEFPLRPTISLNKVGAKPPRRNGHQRLFTVAALMLHRSGPISTSPDRTMKKATRLHDRVRRLFLAGPRAIHIPSAVFSLSTVAGLKIKALCGSSQISKSAISSPIGYQTETTHPIPNGEMFHKSFPLHAKGNNPDIGQRANERRTT